MEIDERIVLNQNNGWTLTTILGRMMQLAEQAFGERDCRYTILGFEFLGQVPHISFFEGTRRVLVRLSTNCLMDPELACYLLAHEVIHLLSPVIAGESTVLEEGLGTHFQCSFMRDHYQQFGWPISGRGWSACNDRGYNEAMARVRELIDIDPEAIMKLRQKQPMLSLFTPGLIRDSYTSLPLSTAEVLCAKFEPWRKQFNTS